MWHNAKYEPDLGPTTQPEHADGVVLTNQGGASPCASCRLRERCPAVVHGGGSAGQILIGGRRLRRGEPVFREGQPCGYLYVVRFGTFKTAFTLNDGYEQVTGFYFAGDMMGFEGIPAGRHATCAIALEDSEICAVPLRELMRTPSGGLVQTPALRLIQRATAELLREQGAKLIVSLRQSDPRVAAFLLLLSRRMRQCGCSGLEFELRMSRQEIGSYLGLTMESVSRALSAFAARGWIKARKRSIRLLDMPSLARLAEPAANAIDRDGTDL